MEDESHTAAGLVFSSASFSPSVAAWTAPSSVARHMYPLYPDGTDFSRRYRSNSCLSDQTLTTSENGHTIQEDEGLGGGFLMQADPWTESPAPPSSIGSVSGLTHSPTISSTSSDCFRTRNSSISSSSRADRVPFSSNTTPIIVHSFTGHGSLAGNDHYPQSPKTQQLSLDVFSHHHGKSLTRGPSPLRDVFTLAPSSDGDAGGVAMAMGHLSQLSPYHITSFDKVDEGLNSGMLAGPAYRFRCPAASCEDSFASVLDLGLHLQGRHRQNLCQWCNEHGGSSGTRGALQIADVTFFSTPSELNWHINLDHLFTCPVTECRRAQEISFGSKKRTLEHLSTHHGIGCRELPDEVPPTGHARQTDLEQSPLPPSEEQGPFRPVSDIGHADVQSVPVEETQASIDEAKKRYANQLRLALDSKIKRSDGDCWEAYRGVTFPMIWEHCLLPFLAELVSKWCGPKHVITVTRGRDRKRPNSRRICIMTRDAVPRDQQRAVETNVRDLVRNQCPRGVGKISLVFTVGQFERLHTQRRADQASRTWARGLGKGMEDDVCHPRNIFAYERPEMGDSMGATLESGEDITATLGPYLALNGGAHGSWLVNFHPFANADIKETERLVVEHPSPADQMRCLNKGHKANEDRMDGVLWQQDQQCAPSETGRFHLGKLVAQSGFDLKTTRISHHPYWSEIGAEPALVVMDWCLLSGPKETGQFGGSPAANVLRRLPTPDSHQADPVTSLCAVTPEAPVCSTGRTSGHQKGLVCEVPAYVSGDENGTGKPTREWFVEEDRSVGSRAEPTPSISVELTPVAESDEFDDEDGSVVEAEDDWDDNAWIRGGIGVPGDSGAPIIDSDSNALVGQVYARNRYYGPGPRLAYFTPMLDLIDDIQEKCDMPARPRLPQRAPADADCCPALPRCRLCYDLPETLGSSRRGSDDSCLSMIPDVDVPPSENRVTGYKGAFKGCSGAGGEQDPDVTSVSELATPRDPARTPRESQAHLVKHAGNFGEPNTSVPASMLCFSFSGGGGGTPIAGALSPGSFGNVVSPAPVHTFLPRGAAALSPGTAEIIGGKALPGFEGANDLRSPYAQKLEDEDFREDSTSGPGPLGKRTATTQDQRSSHRENKRARAA